MHLLVVLQLTVSLSLMQGMVSYTADKYQTVSAFRPMADWNGLYLLSEYSALPDALFQAVREVDPDVDVVESRQRFCGEGRQIAFYTPVFLTDYYKPHLTAGVWFTDYTPADETIPVVAFGDYSPGQVLALDEGGPGYTVIGVSDDPFYFSFVASGAQTSTQMVMQPSGGCFLSLLDERAGRYHDLDAFQSNSICLFLSEDAGFVEAARPILEEYGYVNSFAEIEENGRHMAGELMRVILPFFVFMLALSVLGLIGCVSFSVMRQLRLFSVLFIAGSSRRECVGIAVCYTALILICSLLLFRLVSCFLFAGRLAAPFALLAAAGTGGICLLALLTAVIPVYILKRNPPVQTLRRAE